MAADLTTEQTLKTVKDYLSKKDFSQALAVLNRALVANPKWVEGYLARAALNFSQLKCATATEDCSRAIQVKPQDKQLLNIRASMRLAAFDMLGVIEDVDGVLRLDPKAPDAHYLRAQANAALGRNTQAIADLNEELKLGPNAEAFKLRAAVKYLNGDRSGATADFKQAAAAKDANVKTRITAHQALWDKDALLKDLTEKLAKEPDYITYVLRAELYRYLHDLTKALDDCNKAIALDNKRTEAYHERGIIEVLTNENEIAVEDLTKSIKADPGVFPPGESRYYRSKAYQALGKSDLAQVDAAAATKVKYDPQQESATPEQMVSTCKGIAFQIDFDLLPWTTQ